MTGVARHCCNRRRPGVIACMPSPLSLRSSWPLWVLGSHGPLVCLPASYIRAAAAVPDLGGGASPSASHLCLCMTVDPSSSAPVPWNRWRRPSSARSKQHHHHHTYHYHRRSGSGSSRTADQRVSASTCHAPRTISSTLRQDINPTIIITKYTLPSSRHRNSQRQSHHTPTGRRRPPRSSIFFPIRGCYHTALRKLPCRRRLNLETPDRVRQGGALSRGRGTTGPARPGFDQTVGVGDLDAV